MFMGSLNLFSNDKHLTNKTILLIILDNVFIALVSIVDNNGEGAKDMSNNIVYNSAREIAAKIRNKEVSVTEVMNAHLKQIAETNDKVNAVVSLNEEYALEKAEKADELLSKNQHDGVLFGLPTAIKDTHNAKGFITSRGSTIFKDDIAQQDDVITKRMRNAGAIIIGKTNVPEFAAGSHTFNPVFGATNNPYDLTKSAGGSSGGAAAAVATGMVPLADGSDMGGSCRNPAAYNNVVGLRPSPGRVPMSNKVALYSPMGVQGPIARNVTDLALMMSVIAGFDEEDVLSSEYAHRASQDLEELLKMETKGLKIGFTTDLNGAFPVDPIVRSMFEKQLSKFTDMGCELDEVKIDYSGATQAFQTLRAYEFALNLEPIYNNFKDQIKSTVIWNIEKGLNLSVNDLFQAEQNRKKIHDQMCQLFDEYDYLIMPVSQVQPFDVNIEYPEEVDHVKMNNYIEWMESCSHITVAGNPAISVPGGFCQNGLPFGLQIVAPYKQDFDLLKIAYAFEQATKYGDVKPKF